MRTMAMQRARPTMISPVRTRAGRGSISHARMNMTSGPITQLITNDEPASTVPGDGSQLVVAHLREHRYIMTRSR